VEITAELKRKTLSSLTPGKKEKVLVSIVIFSYEVVYLSYVFQRSQASRKLSQTFPMTCDFYQMIAKFQPPTPLAKPLTLKK